MHRVRGSGPGKKLHLVTFKTPALDYRLPVLLDPDERERLGKALEISQRLGHFSSWTIEEAGAMELHSLMDWLEREGFFSTDGERPGDSASDWPYPFERPSI